MAGQHPRVARTLFDLLIVIDGVEYKCAQVTINFYLNRIPMASATLAVGRHVHTLKPDKSHSTMFTAGSGTAMLKEAHILFKPKGDWEPQGAPWPDSAVIFRGYVTGVGVRTMRGSIRPTVQIIHWLSDLNFSSMLSNQSHPSNPADPGWRGNYRLEGTTTSGRPAFMHDMCTSSYFKPGAVKTDLWGKCLAETLWWLSEQDQIEALAGRGIGPPGSNAQSQKALVRICGGSHSTASCPDAVPLSLHIDGGFDNELAKAIGEWVGREKAEAWWSTTTWNKLANDYAAAFLFAIVPQVEQAMVVPYVPGMRTLWKVIRNTDYNYIDTVATIPRPIQEVVIYQGMMTDTGEGGPESVTRQSRSGGFYRPEGAKEGMLLAHHATGWLKNVPCYGECPSVTAFGSDDGSTVSVQTSTTDSQGLSRGNEFGHTIEETAIGVRPVFNRYAHAEYVQEVLRGRFGVVHGKLRFDIAPGSTVLVEGSQDPFIGSDTLRPNLIGEVHRVTCNLNAEGAKAGTSFQLLHLRTEAENEDDRTSVDQHPLYDKEFKGAPLSEPLAFRSP